MNLEKISNLSYERQQQELNKLVMPIVETETLLRKWQRRLLVALTDEEKQKCKAKIKEYERANK
ncbi:MAG: hypothetical protein EH224_11940 [Calditrichaeota bacterium]|nr:MAG: hypothetical protein EH224_11940 [Calditrichota bacterium]